MPDNMQMLLQNILQQQSAAQSQSIDNGRELSEMKGSITTLAAQVTSLASRDEIIWARFQSEFKSAVARIEESVKSLQTGVDKRLGETEGRLTAVETRQATLTATTNIFHGAFGTVLKVLFTAGAAAVIAAGAKYVAGA